MVAPDVILIYQRAHERQARTETEMVEQAAGCSTRSALHRIMKTAFKTSE
jgi:hypothetical protein